MKIKFLIAALFIGSTLMWTACGHNDKNATPAPAQAAPAIPVTFGSVTEEIVTGNISYPATVFPLNEASLSAEVSGYVTKIFVADGASVSKGQRLYEIDGTRYAAAVQQAKASLRIAQTELERYQTDLNRYQKLADQDAIAKQTFDYAKNNVASAKAQVDAAKATLLTATTNLNRSVIIAPFSGTVGISQVRLGALVNPGTTILNTISSTNPIAVEIQVSEKDINKFVALKNNHDASAITMLLADGSEYPAKGVISTIDRAVDPNTGTIKIRANFTNANNALRPGMNVTLQLSSTSKEPQLVIPNKAVFEELGVFNIYTVNDSSKAEIKEIQLGEKIGDKIVVKSGLKQGDKIVVDGIMNVKNGASLVDAAAANNKQ